MEAGQKWMETARKRPKEMQRSTPSAMESIAVITSPGESMRSGWRSYAHSRSGFGEVRVGWLDMESEGRRCRRLCLCVWRMLVLMLMQVRRTNPFDKQR